MNSKLEGKYIIVITGPTAVGKSQLLLDLFSDYNGPIISADSRQIYKEMTIGTAKPSVEEIKALNLRLVDHTSIHTPYHAGMYEREAMSVINKAFAKGQVPVLSGGTGLYLKAVAEGLDIIPEVTQETIDALNTQAQEDYQSLLSELSSRDTEYYNQIDINNKHRVIRALSVIRETEKPFSSYLNQKMPKAFKTIYIVLERPREILYERINKRVHQMIAEGLLEEVKSLWEFRSLKALQTVGYQELFRHFDGQYGLDEGIHLIQQNSRRYAKRQMTWFRNQLVGEYFHSDDIKGVREFIGSL